MAADGGKVSSTPDVQSFYRSNFRRPRQERSGIRFGV